MTTIIRVHKQDVSELKGMIEEGLHHFGKAMNIAQRLCESDMMGERSYGAYGDRGYMGMREDYPMGERYMGERGGYPPMYPEMMGERRGRSGMTGRYVSY